MLNIAADKRYGKELNGDLYEGKRSLLLIHTYRQCSRMDRAKLAAVLGRPRAERARKDVAWMLSLMANHQSVEYARRFAHALAGAALHEFQATYGGLPPSRDKSFLQGLAAWIFER